MFNLNKNHLMKVIKYLLVLAVFSSCNAPRAVYDYDQQVQFETIDSYKIYPNLDPRMNQLDEQRLVKIFQTELAEEGISLSEDPDIFVNFYASEYETASGNNLGIGVGGGGSNVGVGVSGGIPLGGPDTYLRLTIDFINAESDSLIWQAIVDAKFDKNASPQEREDKLRLIVEKALEGYPPKKK